jgi:hypothetical protein
MEDALERRESRSIASPSADLQAGGAVAGIDVHSVSPEVAIQVVLADLLEEPGRELVSWIQERFPGRDLQFYGPVVNGARTIIDEVVSGLQKTSRGEPSPTLIDRLSFSWRLLKRADILVRKRKKVDIPLIPRWEDAATTFKSILPVPLQNPLLTGIVRQLRLGANAEYLYHYVVFRWAKEPTKLPNPFGNIGANRNVDLLRTVIWWCIRARREEYVEVRPKEQVRVDFGYVVELVLRDVKGWCGPEVEQISTLNDQVEDELNRWLRYSRLDVGGDQSGADGLDPELAKAFIRNNELTTKVARIHGRGGPSGGDERVRQLESQVRQYAEENRALEERLRAFEGTTRVETTPSSDVDTALSTFVELREVLKILDTKYAFDTLNSVQIGEETHLTLRSFVTHLFYALRKRGFAEYPNEDEFVLPYEASGLYDCDGFEVPPAGSVKVRVVRKGWAFNARGKWLPVRRARVVSCRENEGRGSSQ